ncbi:uncharacterized protein LOC121376084 isoform X1 [Gigantopelta aegis]|uniref:uncharacterized protein LOC121376084 isoform X1 n=1 Tax=Gigantopelta aegis TaxID=1735272 RepID=UPI001B88753E|nr:uncharacterized protein LOC121376084 isoform X1 [Gigantopelta aegis]
METDEAFNQAYEVIKATYSGFIPIWIGLQYIPADGTFRWTDGSVTSRTNWYTGGSYNEPDNPQTEHCVAIHKTWDNYGSMVTRECTGKNYNILCGSYEVPMIRSGIFHDVTKSEMASGTVIFSFPIKTKQACARSCSVTQSCSHYLITADKTRCVLFSGNTSSGTTSSGYLYIRV